MSEGKYFKDPELSCSCCGKNEMQQETVDRLDRLRELYGKPIRLSSAYRCPKHNATVSSTGADGPHTTGQSADILCSGADALILVGLALHVGFTGIGIAQKGPHGSRFIHVDDIQPGGKQPRPWLWSYA